MSQERQNRLQGSPEERTNTYIIYKFFSSSAFDSFCYSSYCELLVLLQFFPLFRISLVNKNQRKNTHKRFARSGICHRGLPTKARGMACRDRKVQRSSSGNSLVRMILDVWEKSMSWVRCSWFRIKWIVQSPIVFCRTRGYKNDRLMSIRDWRGALRTPFNMCCHMENSGGLAGDGLGP